MTRVSLLLTFMFVTFVAVGAEYENEGFVPWGEATQLAFSLSDLGQNWVWTNDHRVAGAAGALNDAATQLFIALRAREHNDGSRQDALEPIMIRVGQAVDLFAQLAPEIAATTALELFEKIKTLLDHQVQR